ncbi:hypothetical protein VTK26DRAFT_6835 [Humicola hyalothermophila]
MEAVVTKTRPALSCCCRAVSSGSALSSGVRQKSSSARTRKALNIPPHPSFLGFNADGIRNTTDQIIYNPPSAAPSVYHTPFKFLPKSDPRRRANLASELIASATTANSSSSSSSTTATSTDPASQGETNQPSVEDLPLATRTALGPKAKHHLTKEDVEEMRRLRLEDPVTNSVQSLARRYGCSNLFVLMCCRPPREHEQAVKERMEAVKARWGPRKRAAREERARRFEMLFNGQL